MIKSSEIEHLLNGNTIVETQRWNDMFNFDNTNSVYSHKERINNYEDILRDDNTDMIEHLDNDLLETNIAMASDNTNIIDNRIDRFEKYSHTYSGLVDIDKSVNAPPFKLFSDNGNNGNTINTDYSENNLSHLYFSKENVNNVQNDIRYNVWVRSGKKHIIGKQSTIQLEIIMRSIFLQYSKNLACNLKEQLDELNSYVVEFAVPQILSGIEQYIGYRKDISTLPSVMDYPVNMSIAGGKTLENKAWF